MIKTIDSTTFNKEIYNIKDALKQDNLEFLGKKPALIDFYATWCGPCKTLEAILEGVNDIYKKDINIYKVNVEDERELAANFGIVSVPTLLFVPLQGNPSMSPGLPSTDALKEQIKKMIDD